MSNNSTNDIFVRTPLIESIPLREYVGDRKIYLKLENTQPSGSFKMRGISALCKFAKSKGYTQMVCSSSGNAGLATAYCCMKLGLACHIVVFKMTPEDVCKKIRAYGATVECYGDVWDEAYEYSFRLTEGSTTSFLVHPFNHPVLWEGHSSMIREIAEDLGPEEGMAVLH